MPPPSQTPQTGGMVYALFAFGTWGLLPFYLLLLRNVSALELVGWRAIFTLPVCLIFVAAMGQGSELRRALTSPKIFLLLLLTAALIGNNWLLYVWATLNGHVYAASLGYYINPLLNVVIGTIFLRERLSRGQWVAVGLVSAWPRWRQGRWIRWESA
jgi:chloramphenicol-sensitive protein RarD